MAEEFLRIFFRGGVFIFHHKRKGGGVTTNDNSPNGPHWHGWAGWINPDKVESFNKSTGWVLKGEGRLRNPYSRVRYELSHAAIVNYETNPAGSDRVGSPLPRWFGSFKGLKLAKKEGKSRRCGICCQEIPLDHWAEFEYVSEKPPPNCDWVARKETDYAILQVNFLKTYSETRHKIIEQRLMKRVAPGTYDSQEAFECE
jgi:hypothetical protein